MWKWCASVGTLHVGEISVGVCNGENGVSDNKWNSAVLITSFVVRLLLFNMQWKWLKANLFEKFPHLRRYNNFISKSSHIINIHIACCICFPPNSTSCLRSTKSSSQYIICPFHMHSHQNLVIVSPWFSLMPVHSDNSVLISGQCGRKWSHSDCTAAVSTVHFTMCDAVLWYMCNVQLE